MPKTPTDYSKSVIYKIEHINKPELLYVGSTTNFTKRKYQHKNTCNNINHKQYDFKLYQMIRSNGGFDLFKIMIIKELSCNTKTELLIEEEKYRKELQANLNSCRAYCDEKNAKLRNKEYYQTNKIHYSIINNEYRKNNRELINNKSKERYQLNKDKIKDYHKEHYEINKDIIQQKYKAKYQLNKEQITCECGCVLYRRNKLIHEKTKKHIDLIKI
jgi:hypothetical protein